jgi:hypothetical protein
MKVKFNRFARERAFRSMADFARYADDQAEKFEAFSAEDSRHLTWWAGGFRTNWQTAAAHARDPGSDEVSLNNTLLTRPVLESHSPLVGRAKSFTDRGVEDAAAQLMSLLRGTHDRNNGGSLHVSALDARAEYTAYLALERTPRRLEGHDALAVMLADHEQRLSELLEADEADLDAKREAFETALLNAREHFDELSRATDEALAERQSQWVQTHHDFIEQLKTETAVALWEGRAETHRLRYDGFRNWALIVGIGGLVISLVWIFAGFAFARFMFPEDSTAQIAAYSAGSISLFTMYVWGLRVLVRSMLSQDHLSTDASARSALAHTYLALIKEEAATPEDRAIVLASLFAPVSDGLVKDDGMPALTPAAVAAQILTNPTR